MGIIKIVNTSPRGFTTQQSKTRILREDFYMFKAHLHHVAAQPREELPHVLMRGFSDAVNGESYHP